MQAVLNEYNQMGDSDNMISSGLSMLKIYKRKEEKKLWVLI